MTTHEVVSKDEWVEARKRLLAKEKEFTRMREQLSAERRALPWVRIDKDYTFDGPNGRETLAQLFGDRSQLVVYHFMFAPEWERRLQELLVLGRQLQRHHRPSASARRRLRRHLARAARQAAGLRQAPRLDFQVGILARQRFQLRLRRLVPTRGPGSRRCHLQLRQAVFVQERRSARQLAPSDMPGISVFAKDESGAVFRTYSTFGRGIDMMNTAYHYLDLVPKGRDEGGQDTMAWVKLRDLYDR